MAKILVVVPTLNSYLILDRLVSSVLSQEFQDWRLVFVDGPSIPAHRCWLEWCCAQDARLCWIEQDSSSLGIYGAMNIGFNIAYDDECILFWGSDDWACSPYVFHQLISLYKSSIPTPDLLIGKGYYIRYSGLQGRMTSFCSPALLDTYHFRRYLFNGCTPPHQATLFTPSARSLISSYIQSYLLTADLDYFLRFSEFPGLSVLVSDLDIVFMSSNGISAKYHLRRTYEVIVSYFMAFGLLMPVPFLLRYCRRVITVFQLWKT